MRPDLPLSFIDVATRRISPEDRSPLTRALLEFTFPHFEVRRRPLQVSKFNTYGRDDLEFINGEDFYTVNNGRRYSGDFLAMHGAGEHTLPRKNYYAVCGADGTDLGLLRNELLAYTDFEATGGFFLLDGLLDDNLAMMNKKERQNAIYVFTFPHRVSPFRARFADFLENGNYTRIEQVQAALKMLRDETLNSPLFIGINCDSILYRSNYCLDLRQVAARDAFYRAFSDLNAWQGVIDPSLFSLVADERFEGENFYEMLPTLCNQTQGGGWSLELIGHCLRRLGVKALVYPSARTDPRVIITNGYVTDCRGWNLVCYNSAPPIEDTDRPAAIFVRAPILGVPSRGADWKDLKSLRGDLSSYQDFADRRPRRVIIDTFWNDPSASKICVRYLTAYDHGSFDVDGLDVISDQKGTSWIEKAATGGDR